MDEEQLTVETKTPEIQSTDAYTSETKDVVEKQTQTQESSAKQSVFQLPEKETLAIVTPFAFQIDPALLGMSLAKPWKRGCAQLIDLSIIAFLGSAHLAVSMLFLAYLFYRGALFNKQNDGTKRRTKRLSILAGFLLVAFTLMTVQGVISYFSDDDSLAFLDETIVNNNGVALSIRDNIEMSVYLGRLMSNLSRASCATAECYEQQLSEMPQKALDFGVVAEDTDALFTEILEESTLTSDEQDAVVQSLNALYAQASATQSTGSEFQNQTDAPNAIDLTVLDEEDDQSIIFDLINTVIGALGLSFGWAAFYYTYMLSRVDGRTFGKRVMGLRVLKLDNKPLTLWESFGRYGGYGAGLATGLLGFLQIYWDPNRQAIHDKISSTVVVSEQAIPSG